MTTNRSADSKTVKISFNSLKTALTSSTLCRELCWAWSCCFCCWCCSCVRGPCSCLFAMACRPKGMLWPSTWLWGRPGWGQWASWRRYLTGRGPAVCSGGREKEAWLKAGCCWKSWPPMGSSRLVSGYEGGPGAGKGLGPEVWFEMEEEGDGRSPGLRGWTWRYWRRRDWGGGISAGSRCSYWSWGSISRNRPGYLERERERGWEREAGRLRIWSEWNTSWILPIIFPKTA